MKEFIEKLIGRLEEETEYQYKKADEADICEETTVSNARFAMAKCYIHATEIVNQLAEEYEECLNLCSENCEVYDKEKHYCPKWCKVIRETVEELKEDCNNGWIPCSERLPEVSGEYYTYVYYDGHYMYSIDEIDCDGMIKNWNCTSDYQIIAWRPITPYQQKGE